MNEQDFDHQRFREVPPGNGNKTYQGLMSRFNVPGGTRCGPVVAEVWHL
jgi:hypothetical protein